MNKNLLYAHKNCKCTKSLLSEGEKKYLDEIGLSKHEIRLYDLLLVLGPLSAQDAATHTLDFPSAHYRLFYGLEHNGLIRRNPGRPVVFSALPLQIGLNVSLKHREKQLESMLKNVLKTPKDKRQNDNTQIIIGRKATYDAYVKYCESAKEEVIIYSIGIAYSKKLEKTQKKLIKNNVKVRHIIQQQKTLNYHVIHKWLRIGIRLRYLKNPRGFHFFVIDKKWVCITFSAPNDTENRLSILTDNKPALELFKSQFEQLWSSARGIKA